MRTIFFAIFLLAPIVSNAQLSTFLYSEKLDSIVHKRVCAGGNDAFFAYEYDMFGRIKKEIEHTGTSSVTPKYLETTHYYNLSGHLDSSVTYYYLSSAVKSVKRYFYLGSDLDSLSIIYFLSSSPDSTGHAYKYSYTVNGKRQTELYLKKLQGQTQYIPYERRVWTYDAQQKLIADSFYLADSFSPFTLTSYSEYTYNSSSGKLMLAVKKDYTGYVSGQTDYFYNPSGDLYFEQYWMEGSLFDAWGYYFDPAGNINQMTYFGWSNQGWEPYINYTAEYDGMLASTTAMPTPDVPNVLDKLFNLYRPTLIRFVDTASSGSLLLTLMTYHYSGGVGVEKPATSDQLSFYPNPASDYLILRLPFDFKSDGQIMISDLQGKVIFQHVALKPNKTVRLDLSALPAGMYFVNLICNSQNYISRKLIKR